MQYSARQTVEKLEKKGLGPVKCSVLCGGLSKNKLFIETLAGALGRPVVVPNVTEAVLLGSAMLGAAAARVYPSLTDCALSMASQGSVVLEQDADILRYNITSVPCKPFVRDNSQGKKSIKSHHWFHFVS